MYEKAGHELALLGENLHPVAAAFTDINKTVRRDMDAVKRRSKLFLIRRWA